MKKIKIIGSGRVVKNLLSNYSEYFEHFDLEIYSKTQRVIDEKFEVNDIDSFIPTDDIVILCTSVCESMLLKRKTSKSREVVLINNIELISKYVQRGYFDRGQVFTLTNPSELIAEYIFRKTSNKQVFALGQEVDIKRYKNILNSERKFKCLGQHFQYPIVQCQDDSLNQLKLRQSIVKKIREEFVDDSPPFESGAYNIIKLLQSFNTKRPAMVSSYCAVNDSFLCGNLKTNIGSFTVNKPSSVSEKIFIEQQVNISKKIMRRYL